MDDYNQVSVTTFDRNATQYAEKYFDNRDYDSYYQALLEALPSTAERYIDLACGPGNVAGFIRKHLPHLHILCVDRSEQMLAQARKRVSNIEALGLDCRNLNSITEKFDAASFFFGLSYFNDGDAAIILNSLNDLLNAGSPLLLASVSGDPKFSGVHTNACADSVYSFYRTKDQIIAMVESAGFNVEFTHTVASPANASLTTEDVVILARKYNPQPQKEFAARTK